MYLNKTLNDFVRTPDSIIVELLSPIIPKIINNLLSTSNSSLNYKPLSSAKSAKLKHITLATLTSPRRRDGCRIFITIQPLVSIWMKKVSTNSRDEYRINRLGLWLFESIFGLDEVLEKRCKKLFSYLFLMYFRRHFFLKAHSCTYLCGCTLHTLLPYLFQGNKRDVTSYFKVFGGQNSFSGHENRLYSFGCDIDRSFPLELNKKLAWICTQSKYTIDLDIVKNISKILFRNCVVSYTYEHIRWQNYINLPRRSGDISGQQLEAH